MPACPTCNTSLQTVREREGIYYRCDQCQGRAVTLQQIRRTTGDRYVSSIVRKVNTAADVSSQLCPFCQVPMKYFMLPHPPLMAASCRPCGAVWFDAGKFEQLPEGAIESTDDILIRGIEAEATWKIEQEKQRYQGMGGDPPDEWWKWIPALLGMPVKYESTEGAAWPWVTWSLSAIIAIISISAFFDLRHAVYQWGMIPAHAWRYGGITLITSFFIHGGIWHLVSNLYFFLLFGGEVEAFLGRWRFAGLIFISTIIGDLLHMIFNAHSQIPLIGASGGISGVLVFYALQFPHARLAFLFRIWFRFIWVHIPAWVAFIVWLLLQILGAYLQVAGFSDVASLAHLGGVATGFLLWLVWRKLKAPQTDMAES